MTTQKQLYGIAIFEEEIVMSEFDGAAEKRYTVTTDQLMDFFRSEVVFRPFPGLVWMKSDGTGETYLLTLPAKERTVLYHQTGKIKAKDKLHAIKMYFPAIAVKARISVTDRKISHINMWGFKGCTLKPGSILYELPLPNLSGSLLCLGGTERVFKNDVIAAVEKVIFDTPFNHHNHLVGSEKIPFLKYISRYTQPGIFDFVPLNKIGKGSDILEAK